MGDPLGHALHLIAVLRLIHRGGEADFGDGKHPYRAILQLDLSGKGVVLRRKGGPVPDRLQVGGGHQGIGCL